MMKSSQPKHTAFYNKLGLHCTNGPAIIWDDSDWYWYLNGEDHRYYGPYNSKGDWRIHNRLEKMGG
jgi:hypothetical protein